MNKKLLTVSLLAALGAAPAPRATTILTEGHADIGIAYENGAWDLHVHDEENDIEYAPDEALFCVPSAAASTVPADPAFSFLGAAGDTVYILPQTEVPGLLFLGLGSEEIASGDFQGDVLNLTLAALAGPGAFSLFTVDGLGVPTVYWNSADGLGDTFAFPTGGHAHFNYGFTAPGDYSVGLQVAGVLADGTTTVSDIATYQFKVVPEASTVAAGAMLAVGALGFILRRRRA
ncbi:MAG: choice-of-anchor M domain-containing protein [Limisphaerales bacterium]